MEQIEHRTIYEAIGGYKTMNNIVHAFYTRVNDHPDLKPIFPDDLTETIRRQMLFLTQFFGGPRLYEEERGHPMLRRRHLPFPITPTRRDAWLTCMAAALEEAEIKEPYRTAMMERLTLTANHMMNTPE
ncbi:MULTISPECIES: globin [Oceanobacillus]|uniref:Globin n=1 Tax=Oceanobacillus kimchii TaxID=746691 RepID=A0ABQ5TIU9_9BACI|nr:MULTISPECIES: globin [Oceanobacillus]MBT2599023.1 globin [Oceanobacillus sp. ISL-74]MBT2651941.1 globin [Oceanobacillus sp. ISL-73]MCT1578722.1 globin [Oceanobacillus kimchii]MCT2136229.1 globin [Oceanobacillus kimchii]OEH54356.1 globin [Oceanobacillus sp. E9]